MLDTIHEYAATLLEETGESRGVRRRHAEWAIHLAGTAGADLLDCRNETAWYQALDTELANVRAAIEFMLQSSDGAGVIALISGSAAYWFHRPYPRDLRRWIETALLFVPEPTNDSTIFAMTCLPWAMSMFGDFESAAATADRVLELAESFGTSLTRCFAYYMRGSVAEFSGQLQQALVDYEHSLAYCRESGQLSPLLNTMFEVGGRRLQVGEVEAAVAILDEGLAITRQIDAKLELSYGLLQRGFAALAQSDWQLAGRCFFEGLDLSQRLRLDRQILAMIGGISGVASPLGQIETAARLQGAIEAARRSSGVGRIIEAANVDAIQQATRNQLGSEAYETLLLEGERMSYGEAIASAYRIAADAERRSDQSVRA
jgi:tetratricopeptide (TPR) repeat protein